MKQGYRLVNLSRSLTLSHSLLLPDHHTTAELLSPAGGVPQLLHVRVSDGVGGRPPAALAVGQEGEAVQGLGLGVELGLGADVQAGLQQVRRRGDGGQGAGRGEGGAGRGGGGGGGGQVLPSGVLQGGRGQALGCGLLGLGQEEGGAGRGLGEQGGRRKETGGRGRGLMRLRLRLRLVLHLKHPA